MKLTKLLAAAFMLFYSVPPLLFYTAGLFSEEARRLIPYSFSFLDWILGFLSCLLMLLGLIFMLRNDRKSILLLILSAVFYFLGGVAGAWPRFGVNTFRALIPEFYSSLEIRTLLVMVCACLVQIKDAPASLPEVRDPRGIPELLSALDGPEPLARAEAAASLGRLQAAQARWQLLERLGDEDAQVRLAAADALGSIGDPEVVPGLSFVLGNSIDPALRVAAVGALARIGGASARSVLQAVARDESPEVRDAVERALASARSEAARSESFIDRIPLPRRHAWLLLDAFVVLLIGIILFSVIRNSSSAPAAQSAAGQAGAAGSTMPDAQQQSIVAQRGSLTTLKEAFVEDKMEGKSPDFRKLIVSYDENTVYLTIIFNSGIDQLGPADFVYMYGTHHDMVRLGYGSFSLERDGGADGHFEEKVYSGPINKIPTDAISIEIPRRFMPDIAEKRVWAYSMQSKDAIPDESYDNPLLLPEASRQQ